MALDKADGGRGYLRQKSILHLDDSGIKQRNKLLVLIDWTGTYMITHNIIFGMKKGQTWVARQVRKLPKGGIATLPFPPTLDPPLKSKSD